MTFKIFKVILEKKKKKILGKKLCTGNMLNKYCILFNFDRIIFIKIHTWASDCCCFFKSRTWSVTQTVFNSIETFSQVTVSKYCNWLFLSTFLSLIEGHGHKVDIVSKNRFTSFFCPKFTEGSLLPEWFLWMWRIIEVEQDFPLWFLSGSPGSNPVWRLEGSKACVRIEL